MKKIVTTSLMENVMGSLALNKNTVEKTLITDLDFNRLSSVLALVDDRALNLSKDLDEKLLNSSVIEPKDAPKDLVTMNSRVICRLPDHSADSEQLSSLTLVYPQDADIVSNRISVLSQVGRAILGRRIGEIVTWKGNDGFHRKMKLEKMDYQPEECGDWHL